MKWSNEDFEVLKKYYPIGGYELVNKYLPIKRTSKSINSKATYNNILMNKKDKTAMLSINCAKQHNDQHGEKNPNWKNGISKNNYHYKKLQKERYADHVKAREKVLQALKSGKLIKDVCIICGCKDVVAHHTDYSRPLDVVWMCRKHHRELHDGKIELPTGK